MQPHDARRATSSSCRSAGARALTPSTRAVRAAALARDAGRLRRARARGGACSRRSSASTPINLRARVRPVDARSPTTSTRRSSSSPGCRARSPARSSARRSPPRASCSRRCCATRSPRRSRSACRPARRSARCSRSRSAGRSRVGGVSVGAGRQLRRRRSAPSPIVYALARARHRGLSTDVLLLAGVTLNAFFSALILFVQYFADFTETLPHAALADGRPRRRQLRADRRGAAARCSLPFAGLRAGCARPLNLLSLGADSAETRGVDVSRAQRVAFFSASLATGAAVSLGGPIGFIGIIVPHLVRLIVGADHRVVLPASALFGAAFLVGCDVARAHGARAGRAAGRRHHGAHRRAVLPVAAGEAAMRHLDRRRRSSGEGRDREPIGFLCVLGGLCGRWPGALLQRAGGRTTVITNLHDVQKTRHRIANDVQASCSS